MVDLGPAFGFRGPCAHLATASGRPHVSSVLDTIGGTPLVPMHRISADAGRVVWGKCEHLNPGGSVKDRIALAIVDDAEAKGRLRPGDTLVEATAGNTGIGLALVAAQRGYRLVCVMPEKMSEDKRTALRVLGAEVVITDNAPSDDPRNFKEVARRIAEEHAHHLLVDQFNNPANPRVHETTTGPEIWEQTRGEVAAFVAGVGTGGTLTGVARYLKSRDPGVCIVLADPTGSGLAGLIEHGEFGPDGNYLVEGIGSSSVPGVFEPGLVDRAVSVTDRQSFEMARRLCREEGLLVGGSAGTAVSAALTIAGELRRPGPIVAILPDSWDRYRSRIFQDDWMSRVH